MIVQDEPDDIGILLKQLDYFTTKSRRHEESRKDLIRKFFRDHSRSSRTMKINPLHAESPIRIPHCVSFIT